MKDLDRPVFSKKLRVSAFATLVCFLCTQVTWAAPVSSAAPEIRYSSLAEKISIPETLGRIEERSVPKTPSRLDAPTVIQIQDAHSSHDAQKKIRELLHHFGKEYGFNLVLAEGGAGKLSAKPLQYFEDPKRNQELAARLAEKSEIGGVELYLLDPAAKKAAAYGLEEDLLYWQNLSDYRAVLFQQETSRRFFKQAKEKFDPIASRTFQPVLRRFLKEWTLYQDSPEQMLERFEILSKTALQETGLDLLDSMNQLEWPSLVRFARVKKLEKETDPAKVQSEKEKLAHWLDSNVILSGAKDLKISVLQEKPSRRALEHFYEKTRAHGFRFKDYPSLSDDFSRRVLQSEIDPMRLMGEFEKLTAAVLDKLAQTPEEKKLVAWWKEFRLHEKLFALELSLDDFEKINARRSELRPSIWLQKLRSFRIPEGNEKSIDEIFDNALRFYEGALKRDEAMAQNLVRIMKTTGESKAVIVTGGFHSRGISGALKNRGLAFVQVSPHISELDKGTDYRDVMMSFIKSPLYLAEIAPSAGSPEIQKLKQTFIAAHSRSIREAAQWESEDVSRSEMRSQPQPLTLSQPSSADAQRILQMGEDDLKNFSPELFDFYQKLAEKKYFAKNLEDAVQFGKLSYGGVEKMTVMLDPVWFESAQEVRNLKFIEALLGLKLAYWTSLWMYLEEHQMKEINPEARQAAYGVVSLYFTGIPAEIKTFVTEMNAKIQMPQFLSFFSELEAALAAGGDLVWVPAFLKAKNLKNRTKLRQLIKGEPESGKKELSKLVRDLVQSIVRHQKEIGELEEKSKKSTTRFMDIVSVKAQQNKDIRFIRELLTEASVPEPDWEERLRPLISDTALLNLIVQRLRSEARAVLLLGTPSSAEAQEVLQPVENYFHAGDSKLFLFYGRLVEKKYFAKNLEHPVQISPMSYGQKQKVTLLLDPALSKPSPEEAVFFSALISLELAYWTSLFKGESPEAAYAIAAAMMNQTSRDNLKPFAKALDAKVQTPGFVNFLNKLDAAAPKARFATAEPVFTFPKDVSDWEGEWGNPLTLEHANSDFRFSTVSKTGGRVLGAARDYVRIWDAVTSKVKGQFFIDGVEAAAFSPDHKEFVTSDEKTVIIWNAVTGKKQRRLLGKTENVIALDVAADGRILTADRKGNVKIWDGKTGEELSARRISKERLVSAVFAGEVEILIASEREIYRWNLTEGSLWRFKDYKDNQLLSISFIEQAGQVLAVHRNGKIEILSYPDKKETARFKIIGWLMSAAFSPEHRQLVTVTTRGEVQTLKFASRSEARAGTVTDVVPGLLGLDKMISAKTVVFKKSFDKAEFQKTYETVRQDLAERGLGFLPEQLPRGYFASGLPAYAAQAKFAEENIILLDNRLLQKPADIPDKSWSLLLGLVLAESLNLYEKKPEGSTEEALSFQLGVLWDLWSDYYKRLGPNGMQEILEAAEKLDAAKEAGKSSGELAGWLRAFENQNDLFAKAGAAKDPKAFGKGVQSLAKPAEVQKRSRTEPSPEKSLFSQMSHLDWKEDFYLEHEPYGTEIVSAAFSPDDTKILTAASGRDFTAGAPGKAIVWDAAAGRKILELTTEASGGFHSGVFSPDGKQILTVDSKGAAALWDAETGKKIKEIAEGAFHASFSPDGLRVGILTKATEVYLSVLDLKSGSNLFKEKVNTSSFGKSKFSPDGRFILGVSKDEVMVLNAQTGKRLFGLPEERASVYDAQYSSDGRWIAVAGHTGKSDGDYIQIWKSDGSSRLKTIEVKRGAIQRLEFLKDKRFLLTMNARGAAGIWDLKKGKLVVSLWGHQKSRSEDNIFVTASHDGLKIAAPEAADDRPKVLKVWKYEAAPRSELRVSPPLDLLGASTHPTPEAQIVVQVEPPIAERLASAEILLESFSKELFAAYQNQVKGKYFAKPMPSGAALMVFGASHKLSFLAHHAYSSSAPKRELDHLFLLHLAAAALKLKTADGQPLSTIDVNTQLAAFILQAWIYRQLSDTDRQALRKIAQEFDAHWKEPRLVPAFDFFETLPEEFKAREHKKAFSKFLKSVGLETGGYDFAKAEEIAKPFFNSPPKPLMVTPLKPEMLGPLKVVPRSYNESMEYWQKLTGKIDMTVEVDKKLGIVMLQPIARPQERVRIFYEKSGFIVRVAYETLLASTGKVWKESPHPFDLAEYRAKGLGGAADNPLVEAGFLSDAFDAVILVAKNPAALEKLNKYNEMAPPPSLIKIISSVELLEQYQAYRKIFNLEILAKQIRRALFKSIQEGDYAKITTLLNVFRHSSGEYNFRNLELVFGKELGSVNGLPSGTPLLAISKTLRDKASTGLVEKTMTPVETEDVDIMTSATAEEGVALLQNGIFVSPAFQHLFQAVKTEELTPKADSSGALAALVAGAEPARGLKEAFDALSAPWVRAASNQVKYQWRNGLFSSFNSWNSHEAEITYGIKNHALHWTFNLKKPGTEQIFLQVTVKKEETGWQWLIQVPHLKTPRHEMGYLTGPPVLDFKWRKNSIQFIVSAEAFEGMGKDLLANLKTFDSGKIPVRFVSAAEQGRRRSEVRAMTGKQITGHPAYEPVVSYYAAQELVFQALSRGDEAQYQAGINGMIRQARDALAKAKKPEVLVEIARYLKDNKILLHKYAQVIDESEILGVNHDAFQDWEETIVEKETRFFLDTLGYPRDFREDLEREIKLITYPLSLLRLMPKSIASFQYDQKALELFSEQFFSFKTARGMLRITPILEEDLAILVRPSQDKLDFRSTYFHEIVHYLALRNYLPFDVSNEMVTQAMSAVVYLEEDKWEEFMKLLDKSDLTAKLYEFLKKTGEEDAVSGRALKPPAEIQQWVEEHLAKHTDISKFDAKTKQDQVERLSGIYLAGYAYGLKQSDRKLNLMKYVVDYGKRHLPRVRNADYARKLTSRDWVLINQIIDTLRPVARVTLHRVDERLHFRARTLRDLKSLDRTRWFYDEGERTMNYVPWDIIEYGPDASVGLTLQEVFRANFSEEGLIEEAYDKIPFRLLYGVSETARVVARGLLEAPGRVKEIETFYRKKLRIFDLEMEKERMAEKPLFVQYIEALFYTLAMTEDPAKPVQDLRVTNEEVMEAIQKTFPELLQVLGESGKVFYETVRDKVWPEVEKLLKKDEENKIKEEIENETLNKMIEDGEFEVTTDPLPPGGEGEQGKPSKPGEKLKISISPAAGGKAKPMDLSEKAREKLDEAVRKKMAEMTEEERQALRKKADKSLEKEIQEKAGEMADITADPSGSAGSKGKPQGKPGKGKGGASGKSPKELQDALKELGGLADDIGKQAEKIEAKAEAASDAAAKVDKDAGQIDRSGKAGTKEEEDLEAGIEALVEKIKELRAKAKELNDAADEIQDQAGELEEEDGTPRAEMIDDLIDRAAGLEEIAEKVSEDAAEAHQIADEAGKSAEEIAGKAGEGEPKTEVVKGRASSIQEKMKKIKEKLGDVVKKTQQAADETYMMQEETEQLQKALPDVSEREDKEAPAETGGDPGFHIQLGKRKKTKRETEPGKAPSPSAPGPKKPKHHYDPKVAEALKKLLSEDPQEEEEAFDGGLQEKAIEAYTGLEDWQRIVMTQIRSLAEPHEVTLRENILNALEDLKPADRQRHQRRGRLDPRRLAVVDTGVQDLFVRKIEAGEKKLRLSLLLDVSGSMILSDPNPFDFSAAKAYGEMSEAQLKAKNRINNAIKTAVLYMYAFRDNDEVELEIGLFASNVKIILPFGTPITETKIFEIAYTIFHHGLGGDNSDLAGLRMMVNSMKKRDREEGAAPKILTIVADGGINYTDKEGIQTILENTNDIVFLPVGIGPASNDVKKAYEPYGRVVSDISKLTQKVGEWIQEQSMRLLQEEERSEVRSAKEDQGFTGIFGKQKGEKVLPVFRGSFDRAWLDGIKKELIGNRIAQDFNRFLKAFDDGSIKGVFADPLPDAAGLMESREKLFVVLPSFLKEKPAGTKDYVWKIMAAFLISEAVRMIDASSGKISEKPPAMRTLSAASPADLKAFLELAGKIDEAVGNDRLTSFLKQSPETSPEPAAPVKSAAKAAAPVKPALAAGRARASAWKRVAFKKHNYDADDIRLSQTAFHPQGKFLWTRYRDDVRVWNAKTGELFESIEAADGAPVAAAAFLPDGENLLVISSLGKAGFWNLNTKAYLPGEGWEAGRGVKDIAISPDGGRVLLTYADHSLVIRELKTGKKTPLFSGKKGKLVGKAFYSADGKKIVITRPWSLVPKPKTEIFDAASAALLTSVKVDVQAASLSPDGTRLVILYNENFSLWDAESGEPLEKKPFSWAPRNDEASFSNGIQQALIFWRDGDAALWDIPAWKSAKTFKGAEKRNAFYESGVLSPDGETLVLKDNKGNLEFWGKQPIPAKPFIRPRTLTKTQKGRRKKIGLSLSNPFRKKFLEQLSKRQKRRSEVRVVAAASASVSRNETEHFKVVREGADEYLVLKDGSDSDFKIKINGTGLHIPDVQILETETNVKNVIEIIKAAADQYLSRSPVYLIGEAGTGKNTLAYYAAKLLKKNVRFMAMHEDMAVDDLIERRGVNEKEKGRTDWIPSAIVEAMKHGDWVLLDEVGKLDSKVRAALNHIVQSRRVRLHDGTLLEAKEGFAVIETNNVQAGSNDEKVYELKKDSAEILDRRVAIYIDYLPEDEEKEILNWELMKARGYKDPKEISADERAWISQLVKLANGLRELYKGNDPKTGKSIGRGKLVARPLSTRALVKVIKQVAIISSERERPWDLIRKYYAYQWGRKDQVSNVEAAVTNIFGKEGKGYELTVEDKKGPKYDVNAAGKRVLKFGGVEIELGKEAPAKMDDVPLDMQVVWTEDNLLVLREMLIDIKLKNSILMIGDAGTGKDTIAEYVSYLIYGPVAETYNVTYETGYEDLIAYLGIGEGERYKDGKLTAAGLGETGLVPGYIIRGMRGGYPNILSEINKAKPAALASLNNPLQFRWIDLANGLRQPAEDGWNIIGTMNLDKAGEKMYLGNYKLSGEFMDRFSVYAMKRLEKAQEVNMLIKFNDYLMKKDPAFKKLKKEFIEKLVEFEETLVGEYNSRKLPRPVSMRGVKRMIVRLAKYPSDKDKIAKNENGTPLANQFFIFHDPVHQKVVADKAAAAKFDELKSIIDIVVTTGDKEMDQALEALRRSKPDAGDVLRNLVSLEQVALKKKKNKDVLGKALSFFRAINGEVKHDTSLLAGVWLQLDARLSDPSQPNLTELPDIQDEIEIAGKNDIKKSPHWLLRALGSELKGLAHVPEQKGETGVLKLGSPALYLTVKKNTGEPMLSDLLKWAEENLPFSMTAILKLPAEKRFEQIKAMAGHFGGNPAFKGRVSVAVQTALKEIQLKKSTEIEIQVPKDTGALKFLNFLQKNNDFLSKAENETVKRLFQILSQPPVLEFSDAGLKDVVVSLSGAWGDSDVSLQNMDVLEAFIDQKVSKKDLKSLDGVFDWIMGNDLFSEDVRQAAQKLKKKIAAAKSEVRSAPLVTDFRGMFGETEFNPTKLSFAARISQEWLSSWELGGISSRYVSYWRALSASGIKGFFAANLQVPVAVATFQGKPVFLLDVFLSETPQGVDEQIWQDVVKLLLVQAGAMLEDKKGFPAKSEEIRDYFMVISPEKEKVMRIAKKIDDRTGGGGKLVKFLKAAVIQKKELVRVEKTPSLPRAAGELWEEIKVFKGHQKPVLAVAFSPSEGLVLSGGDEGELKIWYLNTGDTQAHSVPAHKGAIRSIDYTSDGGIVGIVTAGDDKQANVVYVGEHLLTHPDKVRSAVFSPDGDFILTVSKDGWARIWDAEVGEDVGRLRDSKTPVLSAIWSPNGDRILTTADTPVEAVDSPRPLIIWDARTRKQIARWHPATSPSMSLFSPDGKFILTATEDGRVFLWNPETGKGIKEHKIASHFISAVQLLPQGKARALSSDGMIRTFDLDTGKVTSHWPGPKKVRTAVFSKDGNQLLFSSYNDTDVHLWEFLPRRSEVRQALRKFAVADSMKSARSEVHLKTSVEVAREVFYQILDNGLLEKMSYEEQKALLRQVMPEKQVSQIKVPSALKVFGGDKQFGVSIVPAASYDETDLRAAQILLQNFPHKLQVVAVKSISDEALSKLNQLSEQILQGRVLIVRENEKGYGSTLEALFRGDREAFSQLPKFVSMANALVSKAGTGRFLKLPEIMQFTSAVLPSEDENAGFTFQGFLKAELLNRDFSAASFEMTAYASSALSIITAGLSGLDARYLTPELLSNLKDIQSTGPERFRAVLAPQSAFLTALTHLRQAAQALASAA